MDHFIDPPNATEVINGVLALSQPSEIQAYIEKTFPGWLIFSLEKYSSDYPHLQSNWHRICEMNNVQPQKIVLVADIIFDDDHKVVRAFCEYMTKTGYVVRRSGEFIACDKCMSAIPCREVHHLLKEKGLPVPGVWKNKCRTC